MTPGEHIWIIGSDQKALFARTQGFRLRDTVLILVPGIHAIPAYLFRWPIEGLLAENLIRYGKGALAIDPCRIPTNDIWGARHGKPCDSIGTFKTKERTTYQSPIGRWPSNLLLVHGFECQQTGTRVIKASNMPGPGIPNRPAWAPQAGWKTIPGSGKTRLEELAPGGFETVPDWKCQGNCPIKLLDEQSGDRRSSGLYPGTSEKQYPGWGTITKGTGTLYEDSGGASRFFPQFENLAGALDWLARLIGLTPLS